MHSNFNRPVTPGHSVSPGAEHGSGRADTIDLYLREIGREPLLTRAEEVALATRIAHAARETRLAAHMLPDVLRAAVREGDAELRVALRETEGAWDQFRTGVSTLPEYRQVLDRNAALFEERLVRREELHGQARAEGNVERAREMGQEARRLLAVAGETPELLRGWEDEHLIPVAEVIRINDRIAMVQQEISADRKRFVSANLRLVVAVAKQHRGAGRNFEDLISLGNIGLMRAVDRFDVTRGFRFSTYATYWIRQAVTRGVAEEATGVIHLPRAVRASLRELDRAAQERSLLEHRPVQREEILGVLRISNQLRAALLRALQGQCSLDAGGDDPEGESGLCASIPARPAADPAGALPEEVARLVERLSTLLDPRQRAVVGLLFGLRVPGMLAPRESADAGPLTLREAGRILGVTGEGVRQIFAGVQKTLVHSLILDHAGDQAIRHAERALTPSQRGLLESARGGAGELEQSAERAGVGEEINPYRGVQQALDRVAEQVIIDRLTAQERDEILQTLSRSDRRFVATYWLRPTPLLAEAAAELGRTEQALLARKRELSKRLIQPRQRAFVAEYLSD